MRWQPLGSRRAQGLADGVGRDDKFFEGLPGLGSQIKLAPVRDMAELESVLAGLASTAGSSVIVGADPFNVVHGREIVALAERFRLPAVYIYRQLALDGGLMAYGPDTPICRRRLPRNTLSS